MCELIGGGSLRNLHSVYFAVHYTHINTCYVMLLLLTVHIYTMLSRTK